MNKEYNIGIYIRLSMADEDTGYAARRKVTASATSVCSSIAFSTIIRSCLAVSGSSLRMTVIPARTFIVLSSRR